jgi:alanine or glycine:cation symporter, AGCS family
MDLLYIYMENKTRRRNTSMLSMVIDSISSFMYSKLLVIMLIGTGVYFTIRTKFPQVRLFRSACKAVMEKPDDEDAVSSFQALMVSTASRVGTGNIVGVSSAICIGKAVISL